MLTETQILRVVDELLKEQAEKIYTDHDKDWDYKFINNQWFATRKGKNNWLSLEKYPDAIKKLNARYNPTSTPSRAAINPVKPEPLADVPFKTAEQGNHFRGWFIKNFPTQAQRLDLDPTGSFNNSYIQKAYNMKTSSGSIAGQLYFTANKGELYSGANQSYRDRINVERLSPTDTTKVCDIGDETTDCAQFVNNFSDQISAVGNAWEAYENGGVGKNIFSVFRGLSYEQMKKYQAIYQEIKAGGDPVDKIKRLEEELIAQNGQPDPKKLKLGDVVGLYYEPSTHHTEAFIGSATYREWYPDGKMGKTIVREKIGHTFNTHVGVVGAAKDGVPLIFHNVQGTLLSDPPQNLKIVWVKRPK